MGNRGRYGKYGESKRFDRLRRSGLRGPVPGKTGKGPSPAFPPKGPGRSPGQRIAIRLAGESDVGYIGHTSGVLFDIYGPYRDMVAQWVQASGVLTLVAESTDGAVGFAMMGNLQVHSDLSRSAELLAIAVSPGNQRRGIGQRLLKEIERRASEFQIRRLFLHTAVDNLRARTLFSKAGYRAYETRTGFYPAGQNALAMFKDISGAPA